MKKQFMAVGLLALAAEVIAQSPVDGSHYRAGQIGIKGGAFSEPGIYLRDDNWFYTGNADAPSGYKTFVYVQAPQLMWVTDWKILGARLGMDVEIPFEYREASHTSPGATVPGGGYPIPSGSTIGDHQSGLGDIKLEPLLLSWHWRHFDTTVGYALWAPTGNFSEGSTANLGDPDAKKSWTISVLHHYEFNNSQVGVLAPSSPGPGSGYPSPAAYSKISCSTYTLEWSASKTILTNADVGVFGYYQKQFTDSSPAANSFKDSEAAGLGPEISFRLPRWDLSVSVRYAYEFTAYNRPKGHAFNLTLAKKF
jgi:hypothetical protein